MHPGKLQRGWLSWVRWCQPASPILYGTFATTSWYVASSRRKFRLLRNRQVYPLRLCCLRSCSKISACFFLCLFSFVWKANIESLARSKAGFPTFKHDAVASIPVPVREISKILWFNSEIKFCCQYFNNFLCISTAPQCSQNIQVWFLPRISWKTKNPFLVGIKPSEGRSSLPTREYRSMMRLSPPFSLIFLCVTVANLAKRAFDDWKNG